MRVASLICIAFLVAAPVAPVARAAGPDTILYAFEGGAQGAFPARGLIPDGHGGFFGTTLPFAGANGAVWDLTPPSLAGGPWSLNLLTVFQGGEDGTGGGATLLADGRGNLFGVTSQGGAKKAGTVFELSPPASGGSTAWTRTTLYSFRGQPNDGLTPDGGLVMDPEGALYGVAEAGGDGPCEFGCGLVYKLSPPKTGGGAWSETALHVFQAYPDGAFPAAALVFDPSGNLWGATAGGGLQDQCGGGCGVIFRLSRRLHGPGWDFTVIKALTTDLGGGPLGALLRDGAGNFYGTAYSFGRMNSGTAFEVSPPPPGLTRWTARVLHTFQGDDGEYPNSSLIADDSGALYGTAYLGGHDNQGVAFRLQPPAVPGGRWTERQLHAFRYHRDGAEPAAPLIFGPAGLLYGATVDGGKYNLGTVFSIVP